MGFFKDLFTPKAEARQPRTPEESRQALKHTAAFGGAAALLANGTATERAAMVALPLAVEAITLNHAMGYDSYTEPILPQGWIEADEVSDTEMDKYFWGGPTRPSTPAELNAINDRFQQWSTL